MSDKEQRFTVLRCKGVGFDGQLIPGTYRGKDGRGNKPFAKAALLNDPKKIEAWLDMYGRDNYETVEVVLIEP